MSNPSHESRFDRDSHRGRDRRRSERFDTSLEVAIRFLPDGEPLTGWAKEIGPNGMRLVTTMPLVEASYVHVSFEEASNQTRCEGRVVWTERNRDGSRYESGIDIQRWGGDSPSPEFMKKVPNVAPKKDRRRFRR
jgi:hypothetical protein